MEFEIEVIKNDKFIKSNWSGGTTTELMIYPKDSKYSMRNFLFRLSSAKVSLEESTFTNLPGIDRIIMIIDGEMTLFHEGHHSIKLKPFEQDSFKGEWTTKSKGRVTDFNLMMAKGCSGKLEVLSLEKSESKNFAFENIHENYNKITHAFYIIDGNIEVNTKSNEKLVLEKNDLLTVTGLNGIDIPNLAFLNKHDGINRIIKSTILY